MGLFPGSDDDETSDQALIKAARKRIMRELEAQHAASVVNNITQNASGGGRGGLMESMNGGGGEDPGLYDYLVDIEKKDIPGENGGKPMGWTKKVHRYRSEKKK